jgi:hypothetical protein
MIGVAAGVLLVTLPATHAVARRATVRVTRAATHSSPALELALMIAEVHIEAAMVAFDTFRVLGLVTLFAWTTHPCGGDSHRCDREQHRRYKDRNSCCHGASSC